MEDLESTSEETDLYVLKANAERYGHTCIVIYLLAQLLMWAAYKPKTPSYPLDLLL